jgi:4-amino-4-deoxy-L-arabinose transferase-like glycosyltransferase
MSRYYVLLLVVVLALGAWLRIYDLSNVPTGQYAEELDLYNSVYSIVTTGHDVDGTLMPYLYQRNVRRNAPLYAIVGYGSTLVFGKNAFGLRLPAALFGISAIALMYFLAFALTRRRDVAFVATLVQAIAPLFVHFSRISW